MAGLTMPVDRDVIGLPIERVGVAGLTVERAAAGLPEERVGVVDLLAKFTLCNLHIKSQLSYQQ